MRLSIAVLGGVLFLLTNCAEDGPLDEPFDDGGRSGCGDDICDESETCESCEVDCVCLGECGDGDCDASETCASCPGDCDTCEDGCGDGGCDSAETCATCPSDCGSCSSSASTEAAATGVCRDGACSADETCATCPDDCGSCAVAATCLEKSWSFINTSDSYGGLEGGLASAVAAGFRMNDDLKFMIGTGDFENMDTIDQELNTRVRPFRPDLPNVPWFTAVGNHNVEDPADMSFMSDVLGPRIQTQLTGLRNFHQGPINPSYFWTGRFTTYSFDYENAHFIVLNHYLTEDSPVDPMACPSNPLLAWLEQDLAQNRQPLVFVFGHEPAFPWESSPRHCGDSLDEGRCPGNRAPPPDTWKAYRPARDRFWQLLRSYNVVAHIDGHTHQASVRVLHGISDFPMESCIDTDWNCYCKIERQVPFVANHARLTPADGTVALNNGLTVSNGPLHIVRVQCGTVTFYQYSRSSSTEPFQLRRRFDYRISGNLGRTLYVDPGIATSQCTTYDPATRQCGAGTAVAYKTFASASSATRPDDLVLVRGGVFNEPFRVRVSGDPPRGKLITYRAYSPSEPVVITRTGSVPGILIEGKSGIVMDGFQVDDVPFWAEIIDGHHNTIVNIRFTRARDTGTRSGLKIVRGSHNKVFDSTFDDGNDELVLEDTNRNVIQGNRFTKARHSLLNISCSNYNVVRRNYFHNELQKAGEEFDCEGVVSSTYHGDRQVRKLDATKHNIWEQNVFAHTAPANGDGPFSGLQYAGQQGLVRRNVFYDNQGGGLALTHYSSEALHCNRARVVQNVFYANHGGAVITDAAPSATTPTGFWDNRLVNNVFYRNTAAPLGWADLSPGGTQLTHRSVAAGGFVVRNNNVRGNAGDVVPIFLAGTRMTLASAQSKQPGLFVGNVSLEPGFASADGHDFRLNSVAMVDRGAFLTRTVNAGSGKVVPVADVGYFFDGYGIGGERGDLIRFEGSTRMVRIVAIDHANSRLTLDQSVTWTSGQGVTLAFTGSGPDLGACEVGIACPAASLR